MISQPVRSNNSIRLRGLAGWGVCLLPALALVGVPFVLHERGVFAATASTTQPATPTNPSQPGNSAPVPPPAQVEPPDSPGPNPFQRGRFGPNSVTAQEINAAPLWMQQNAPQRWSFMQNEQKTSPAKYNRDLREYIALRIRPVNWLKNSDPEVYNLRMERIKLEDDAFGILQSLNAASPTQKPALTDQLRTKLAAMYDNTLAERQQRIDELSAGLKKAQAELDADMNPAHKAKHIENSLDRALQTGNLDRDNRDNRDNGGGPHMHGNPPMPPPTSQPYPG